MSDWINDRTSRDHVPAPAGAWQVVVPVKGGPDAKSRLRAPDGVDRLVLARALALDTVTAAVEAVGAQHVVVVTSDPDVVASVDELAVSTLSDPGEGLNAAVRAALAWVPSDHSVAVLLGDVPPSAPSTCGRHWSRRSRTTCWFVPDAEAREPFCSVGTTHHRCGHDSGQARRPGTRRRATSVWTWTSRGCAETSTTRPPSARRYGSVWAGIRQALLAHVVDL
jgi:hypothetical protein